MRRRVIFTLALLLLLPQISAPMKKMGIIDETSPAGIYLSESEAELITEKLVWLRSTNSGCVVLISTHQVYLKEEAKRRQQLPLI